MVDPLSTAASVAGLLSLGLQSAEYLYDFYAAYRERDYELARIADQLYDLLCYLQTINDVVHTRKLRADEKTIIQNIGTSLTRCKEVIYELRDEVDKFKKESKPDLKKAIVGAGRRAVYPFRRSTLEKLNEDVDYFRNNFSLVLQALQVKEHQNTQNDLDEVKHIVKTAQAYHLTASVRQWLKAADASIDYNNVSNKRHAGTGQWFVQSVAYSNWLQEENSLLWLHGFAGCGKSVLCSTAIQHTFRHQRRQVGSAVAFFFFTYDDNLKQECSAALRALLFQLSGEVDGLEAELMRLQSTYNHSTPPVPILMEYLRQAITRCRHVYILLDALDESPEQTARADVLQMIETIRQWQLPGLHLLVTSRDVSDIRSCLDAQQIFSNTNCVPMKNNSIDKDIQNYVSYQVDHERDLRCWSNTDRQRIKNYLSQHADGVFRWVQCQLDPLKRCPRSVKYLDHCLKTLPQSLDQTYERILCSISEESQDDAQRILSLLCYAPRPLSVGEVIEALTVDLETLQCYDQDRKLSGADDLLRICAGLIEISFSGIDNNSGSEDDENMTRYQLVRLGHFSVQEYLVSDRIKRGSAVSFALSASTQHAQISKICVLYLSNKDFLGQTLLPQVVRKYQLARYAAQYWHDHYQHVEETSASQLSPMITTMLTERHLFEYWVRLWNPDQPWNNSINYQGSTQAFGSPTYYVALLGLDDILSRLLSISNIDVNAQGGFYGTALQAASAGGHEKIVQILLDNGADVLAQGGEYSTALQAASLRGHEKIVQILLDKGADVRALGGFFGTALQAASLRGHEKIVQILLDNRADVLAQGGKYSTALQAASAEGHEKIVQILLDNGADVLAQGGEYSTALQAASAGGHEKIVQILLDKGADVQAQGGCYGTALQAASAGGHEKIAQILLDKGADVQAQGGHYGTALQAASAEGHEKVVQILLDQGVSKYSAN